jgi:hypothetical protein
MTTEFNRKADYWPTDPEAVKRLERRIEFGELAQITPTSVSGSPRYLVTYMKSNTSGRIRSGTVVTVTNQSSLVNRVWVFYFSGFTDNYNPDCVSAMAIPPDYTVDFCSRSLPSSLTTCNTACDPELTFHEGRAIVVSMFPEIGVSSRVYYTRGSQDEELLAITDSKIVRFGRGNRGD